jgi:hypothetical protein
LDDVLGQPQVIVGEKDGRAAYVTAPREAHPLLHEGLTSLVARMRLARHHDLHRAS